MLRKLFFITLALFGMTAISSSVSANEATDIYESVMTDSYAGIYNGSLIRVYMNGEKNPVSGINTIVTDNGDGTVNLLINAFQVGKMPGTITVDAKNVAVDENGHFDMPKMAKIVILRILGIPSRFNANLNGDFSGNSLTFSVETVGAKYLGIGFEAAVTFQGTK
ncbi:calycin-like domain-containing protein [Bacteroides helcogenes]|uniref:Lipocalin-like domain-containing protein n=1 Tax=Bacteroides helcogenes (strain ATCC 35417 / DSM 20613 / JCM 6297 / CCUG 15421 / P 36-108) TaxID=693979 RepID=E6SP55_BACT6|nr:calycin-like domain-containing protein [Bacteroides helcogenes]ADV43825.1 hypothetical protein Bache_1847 [Bacteroides helcogenes P 36-108]MDY5237456.1 calycin-like domain-containing protein [Bacteroides helcogenes]